MSAEAHRHRRLRELFHEAVELPAAERLPWMAAHVEPDLAPELESLLLAHEEAGEFLENGLAEHQEALDADVGASLVGRRLGPYRLERLVGRGGMGAVYLARRDDDEFRRDVAVKLLRPELASPDLVRRFRLERQTLANLDHPNVARLLDGGTTEDGLPYLVMEYVEGKPLEEFCRERRLGLPGRLSLFATVCGAVEEAHRHLIVHRDIKPANLLVADDGTVKLLDFGIAKLLESDPAELEALTRAMGYATLAFASPEQLTGKPVTTATDVYALGVLLYRLLSARHPYALEGKTQAEAVRAICEEDPSPPSRVVRSEAPGWEPDPARLARSLAGDLDQIVLKALRKEPARRYGSVAELSEDLRRHAAGLPVGARPDTLSYRFAKFTRRHRAGIAVTASALLALVVGLAAYVRQVRLERSQARLVAIERAKAEQVSSFLEQTLASADPGRGGRSVSVAEVLDRASERLSRDLAGQPEVESSLRETLAETYLGLGLPREAEREIRRALEIGTGDRLEHLAALGRALADQGRYEEARTELKRSLAICRQAPSLTLPCVRALDVMTVTLQHLGRASESTAAGQEALTTLRRSFSGEKSLLASVLNNLGITLGNQGQLAEAEALHREAVAAAREAHGERHPLAIEALANLAGILDIQGRHGEAAPLFQEALAAQETVIGERHFDFIRTLTTYANMLWLMKRSAEAEPHARRAQALAVSSLGAGHPLTAYAENILGGVLLDVGKPVEAEAHIRVSLAARREALPPGHWLTASAQSNLGAALLAQRRLGEARRELQEAYDALVKDRGPAHEKSLLTAGRLADLHAARGEPGEARRYRELSKAPSLP